MLLCALKFQGVARPQPASREPPAAKEVFNSKKDRLGHHRSMGAVFGIEFAAKRFHMQFDRDFLQLQIAGDRKECFWFIKMIDNEGQCIHQLRGLRCEIIFEQYLCFRCDSEQICVEN